MEIIDMPTKKNFYVFVKLNPERQQFDGIAPTGLPMGLRIVVPYITK